MNNDPMCFGDKGLMGNMIVKGLTGNMIIYEEPLPEPKIQLREHVQVTDECRRETNAWLLARFGRKKPVLDIAPHGMRRIIGNFCA